MRGFYWQECGSIFASLVWAESFEATKEHVRNAQVQNFNIISDSYDCNNP